MDSAFICILLKYYYLYLAISAILVTFGLDSQITYKTVGRTTIHAILQLELLRMQKKKKFNSIILTNYAVKRMYMVLNSLIFSFS